MSAPYWLNPYTAEFPPVDLALSEPNGLLGVGGDLTVKRLLNAYRHGIFPWYSQNQPILWWSPDPRLVLYPERIIISRSLRKTLRKAPFMLTLDSAFSEVMQACAAPRKDQSGTWITDEMQQAYVRLHECGYAHSIECWQDGHLVGGLYGVALGKVFFGESMFSQVANASKIALVHLCAQLYQWRFAVIDCQVNTPHLVSLGAQSIPRRNFQQLLDSYCDLQTHHGPWSLSEEVVQKLSQTGTLEHIQPN